MQSWFRNNKRLSVQNKADNLKTESTPDALPTFGTLKMKKKRVKQAWQAYHVMTYEKKWKAVIDTEWAAYIAKWAAEHPGEECPTKRFVFMNAFMRQKYSEESAEVKAEVEEFRLKEQSIPEDINVTFQRFSSIKFL